MKTILLALLLMAASAIPSFAQAPRVDLSWTAGVGNPTGTTYNVYRGAGPCGIPGQVFNKVNTATITSTSYSDSSITRGTTYCYRATSVFGAQESAPSSTAAAVIPLAAPEGFTVTVQVAVNININGTEVAAKTVRVEAGQ